MAYTGKTCWLCGRNGSRDPLDRHHIFAGPLRDKSERYDLCVYLCHERCHENGARAAHRCRDTREKLCRYGQRKAMEEQGWTVTEFRLEFGKNWLDEEEIAEIEGRETSPTTPQALRASSPYAGEPIAVGFRVLEAAALPF